MKKSILAKVAMTGVILGAVGQAVPMDQPLKVFNQDKTAHAAEAGVIEGFAWFEGSNAPWTDAQATLKNNTYQKGTDFMVMGLEVRLKNNSGAVIQTTTTDGQGKFAFTPVADGDYLVSFINPLVWSPVISNITLGVDPSNDSDGPTDVLVKVTDGVAHAEAPTQELDAYVSQGFYTGSGALVNSGVAPTITGANDVEGIVNTKFPAVAFQITDDDKEPATVEVTGLPAGLSYVKKDPVSKIDANGNITFVENSTIEGTPTKVGTYPVTITATDIFGNKTTKTFNVNVKDVPNSKPVLTANNATIPYGSTFNAKSYASAADTQEGDISSKIVVSGDTVDTSKPGTYNVTYTVTDQGGLSDTKTITVTVQAKPNAAPTLTVANQTIPYGSKTPLADLAKATDPDGDTVTITTNPTTIDTTKPGTYQITYTADDGKGGKDTKTVTITVAAKPNSAPKLNVADQTIPYGSKTPLADLAKATDPDGDTVTITTNPTTIDTTKSGPQQITFTADDGKGGKDTKTVTITVGAKPNGAPVLTAGDLNVTKGQTPDYMKGVSAIDPDQGDITNQVKVDTSKVDLNKAGTYPLTYSITDDAGVTKTVTTNLTVTPTTFGPKIIANDEYIMEGSTFDPMDNVWAIDKDDVDLTDEVKLKSGSVDTSKPGSYDLTYTVTDSDGHTTDRTVTITVGTNPQKALDSLQSQIDALKAKDAEQDARLDKLENDYAALNGKVSGLDDRLTKLESEMNQVKADIQTMKDQIKTLESRIQTLENDVDGLKGDVANIKAEISKLTDLVQDLRERITTLENRVSDLEDKHEALKSQVDKNTQDISNLQTKINEHENRLNNLETRLTDAEKNIKDLQTRVTKNESDIKSLNERVTKLETEIKTIKSEITRIKEEIKALQASDAKQNAAIKDLQNKVSTLESKVKTLEEKVSVLEKKVQEHDEAIKSLTDRVTKNENAIKTLENRVSTLEKRVDGHDKEIASLKEKISTLEKEITSLKERIKVLEENDKKQDAAIKDLQDRVTNLEKEVKSLKDRVSALEEDVKELQSKPSITKPKTLLPETGVEVAGTTGFLATAAALITFLFKRNRKN